jgi:Na+/H+ antiporter NhaA
VLVLAFITTIGFTMALFFATVAHGEGAVLSGIKVGTLATVIGALFALAAARLVRVGRFARHETRGRPHGTHYTRPLPD